MEELRQIISKYSIFWEKVECYCIYFQIKYLLRQNEHPVSVYAKIFFIQEFFDKPLFRFLLVALMGKNSRQFSLFERETHQGVVYSKFQKIFENQIDSDLKNDLKDISHQFARKIKLKKDEDEDNLKRKLRFQLLSPLYLVMSKHDSRLEGLEGEGKGKGKGKGERYQGNKKPAKKVSCLDFHSLFRDYE